MNEEAFDLSPVRKVFSRIGWALSAVVVIATALQLVWFFVPELIWGADNWMSGSSLGMWLGTFLPMYVFAIPTALWILKKLPAQAPEQAKLGAKRFFLLLPICFFVMYTGNLIGTVMSLLLSAGTAENAVLEYAMDTSPLKVLFMVILAPLLEEYVCRKQIIDRTCRYGEKTAAVLSAVTFGLLHQNLFQFFYAFGLGLIFAYVYIRTGRLRYSVVFHGIINFMGSVLAPWILSLVDLEALTALETMDPNAAPEEIMAIAGNMLPGLVAYMLYACLLVGLAIAGLALLLINRKKILWKKAENQLPAGTAGKTAYLNVGMVVYILLCIASFVFALL